MRRPVGFDRLRLCHRRFAAPRPLQPFYVEMPPGPVEEAAVPGSAAVLDRSPEDIAGEDLRLHRRRKRLATGAIVGLVALTLASVAASVLAIRSSAAASRNEQRALDQTRQAVADAMAARALVERSERPDKAFALALASSRLDPSGSGEAVLLRLAAGTESTDRFVRIDAEPTAVALNPEGDTYAIGDARGGIRLGALGSRARVAARGAWKLRDRNRLSRARSHRRRTH